MHYIPFYCTFCNQYKKCTFSQRHHVLDKNITLQSFDLELEFDLDLDIDLNLDLDLHIDVDLDLDLNLKLD